MTLKIETGTPNTTRPTLLFRNLLAEYTVTFSSQETGAEGLNCLEDTTFDFWRPTNALATASFDAETSVAADFIGIAAHDVGTNGATIQVQSSTDNVNWTTRATVSPLTDETIVALFPEISARYWRVRLTNAIASYGVIKLGKRLVIEGGLISGHVSIDHARRVELLTNNSMSGQFLGNRPLRIGAETELNFGFLETTFVDTQMATFERHFNNGGTFFYAGSPATLPRDIGYCWRSSRGSEMRPSYDHGGLLMPVTLQVDAYVR
jgi:hypothetical protein